MKVSIIGSDNKVADFLRPYDLVKDPNEADIVIFGNNFSYRSATAKFNKLDKNKLIIGFNSTIPFFQTKYNYNTISCKPSRFKQTLPVFCDNDMQYEGLFDISSLILTENRYTVCAVDWTSDLCITELINKDNEKYFRSSYTPIVSRLNSDKYPDLLMIQLDLNKIPESILSQYIKNYICELINTH